MSDGGYCCWCGVIERRFPVRVGRCLSRREELSIVTSEVVRAVGVFWKQRQCLCFELLEHY